MSSDEEIREMPFPDYDRTVYDTNPIFGVVCQFRFPPILRISKTPDGFQERIRREYPEIEKRIDNNLFPPEALQQLPDEFKSLLAGSATEIAYDFVSRDGNWVVSLNDKFLALTARDYTDWSEFTKHLETPFKALIDEYEPSYFTRIGLRYQNHIIRSEWGLEDVPWTDFLNSHLTGVVADPEIGDEVSDNLSQTVIDLHDDGKIGKVTIRHGLARRVESGVTDDEAGYLIDNDLYIDDETTEIENGTHILDKFHFQSGKIFNWCIKDKFREAMGNG